MLETMTIRCDQCGHENNPLYRFCGMCGAPLAAPAPQSRPMPSFTPAARPLPRNDPPRPARPAPPPQESWPVSGPSFLGLADEPASPSRNVDYLLDDDDRPRRTYGRAFFILLILAGFGAFLYYQWRGDSGSLARLWSRVNPQSAAPAPPAAQPTPPPIAPEASPDVAGQPHSATVTEQQSAQPAANNAAPAQPAAAAPTPSPAANAQSKAEAAPPESPTDNQEQQAEAAPAEKPAPAKSAPHPARKPAPAAASAPEPTAQDSLAIEGERYLYGNGVQQNCDRAQRSLTRAAQGGSAKAYTLLGAMYATGHCATRDLPTSYRWFARALHQDPSNTRLEKNLEVVWRQMTPEERQLATRQ